MKSISQKGLGAPEILLLVSLFVSFFGGSVFAYMKYDTNKRITNEVNFIKTLVDDSKVFININKMESINTKVLAQIKVLKDEDILTNGKIKSNLSDGIDVETIYNNKDRHISHIKLTFHNFQQKYCENFLNNIETTASLITIEKRLLKNHFDKNNLKNYEKEYADTSCALIGESYGIFPMILIFPYNNE